MTPVVRRDQIAAPRTDQIERPLLHENLVSERLRVTILAWFLSTILAAYVLGELLFPGIILSILPPGQDRVLLMSIWATALIYELVVCGLLGRFIRTGHQPPLAVRYLNAAIETSLPTLALIIFADVVAPIGVRC